MYNILLLHYSDKYVTDAQNLREHVMKHNHGTDENGTSINCLKIVLDTEYPSWMRTWGLMRVDESSSSLRLHQSQRMRTRVIRLYGACWVFDVRSSLHSRCLSNLGRICGKNEENARAWATPHASCMPQHRTPYNYYSSAYCAGYRPCYTKQFFFQLVSQQTLREKLQGRFHV